MSNHNHEEPDMSNEPITHDAVEGGGSTAVAVIMAVLAGIAAGSLAASAGLGVWGIWGAMILAILFMFGVRMPRVGR